MSKQSRRSVSTEQKVAEQLGRGPERWCSRAPWLCRVFPASCPSRGSITPSPTPATSNWRA
jgi:hypothetical protein